MCFENVQILDIQQNGELKVYPCRKIAQIITNDCDFFIVRL